MSESLAVTQAHASDFAELLEVLHVSYGRNVETLPPFDILYPDIYRPVESDLANIFVIRDQGKIVNTVGLYPLHLYLGESIVEIGGIGGVCTLPEYRGKNLMKQNFDFVMGEMVRREYPFGWLSGDRRRYRPWGFEICKNKYCLTLGARGPGFENYIGKVSGRIKEGLVDELDWPTLWRQTENFPELRACGEEKLRLKYRRIHQKIYMVEGTPEAHILVHETPECRQILSYAGDPATVAAIAAEKIKSDAKEIEIIMPAHPNLFCGPMDELMTSYQLAYSGEISIVNLAKTFSLFRTHLDGRVSDLGLKGSVRLVMGPTRQTPRQEVILEADGRQLHIETGVSKSATGPAIEMTCHQMVELLFSPLCLNWMDRIESSTRWLAALMPLPIFIPPLYHV